MRYSEVNNSIIENSCGWKTEKVLWTKKLTMRALAHNGVFWVVLPFRADVALMAFSKLAWCLFDSIAIFKAFKCLAVTKCESKLSPLMKHMQAEHQTLFSAGLYVITFYYLHWSSYEGPPKLKRWWCARLNPWMSFSRVAISGDGVVPTAYSRYLLWLLQSAVDQFAQFQSRSYLRQSNMRTCCFLPLAVALKFLELLPELRSSMTKMSLLSKSSSSLTPKTSKSSMMSWLVPNPLLRVQNSSHLIPVAIALFSLTPQQPQEHQLSFCSWRLLFF